MENIIRLSAALGVFSIMASWEWLRPRRTFDSPRRHRWPINLGLALLNMLVVRLSLGSIAYLSAVQAQKLGWGLLNLYPLPNGFTILITLLVLDVAIYAQHILMHKWSLLWRLHQVHHTDIAFDATTAVRFHPFEIVLSLLIKVFFILLLGAEPLAVIAFEIILNATATFNHSNVAISEKVDHYLRYLLVTPDMHRIHHSTVPAETDSNYGFSVSWWDRLFKTYTANPQQAQVSMPIGLAGYRDMEELRLLKLLALPFKKLRH
ncbi:MAG: sterol desaturase family protein [Methylococcales bacterium]